VKAAQGVAGDMSRRKKVKEKRPSPFLFYLPLPSSVFNLVHQMAKADATHPLLKGFTGAFFRYYFRMGRYVSPIFC